MLVKQRGADSFLTLASNAEYLTGIGHRVAAVEDSRLLAMVQLASGLPLPSA